VDSTEVAKQWPGIRRDSLEPIEPCLQLRHAKTRPSVGDGAPRVCHLGRPLHKLRSFAEELDRKVDLTGNVRPRVLRRHRRKSVVC
jgi:hypothetical protein